MSEGIKASGKQELHTWFGLSYASWLTLPRAFMQEMPDDWQRKMAELLNEYDSTFNQLEVEIDSVIVIGRKDNKNCKIPEWIVNYRRPNREKINSIKFNNKGE